MTVRNDRHTRNVGAHSELVLELSQCFQRHLTVLPFLYVRVCFCGQLESSADRLRLLASSPHLITATSLYNEITPQLEKCPSETYIIVSQPGVNAADYHNPRATPNLRQMVQGREKGIRSSLAIQDVKGSVDADALSSLVQTRCGAGHLRVDASSKLGR